MAKTNSSKGVLDLSIGAARQTPRGYNYLLLIAIDEYEHFPRLHNCVGDAEAIHRLLTSRYHFEDAGGKIVKLTNKQASREGILKAFKELRHKINSQPKMHNLIVYFSGHGAVDGDFGYWIPADARQEADYHFISMGDIRDRLTQIESFHTLLVVDACFSGSLFISGRNAHLGGLETHPSRWGITSSHSREYASDGKPGDNSPFSRCLIEALKANKVSLSVQALDQEVSQRVHRQTNGKQTPICRPLDVPGDDLGQFFFHLKEKAKPSNGNSIETFPAGFEYLASDMVLVDSGEFLMGDTFNEEFDSSPYDPFPYRKEKPLHSVAVSSFYLCRYQVTVRQFSQYIQETGYKTDAETEGFSRVYNYHWFLGARRVKKIEVDWRCDVFGKLRNKNEWNHPVIHVSWNDAVKYCHWLSKKTGKNFRLPTEAEWEYAARQRGEKVRFGNGKDIATSQEINFDGRSKSTGFFKCNTTPVGSMSPANSLGFFDMSGNVWEWCSDWYMDYPSGAQNNPRGASSGIYKICRGGSWYEFEHSCRVSCRLMVKASNRYCNLGFRLAYC